MALLSPRAEFRPFFVRFLVHFDSLLVDFGYQNGVKMEQKNDKKIELHFQPQKVWILLDFESIWGTILAPFLLLFRDASQKVGYAFRISFYNTD